MTSEQGQPVVTCERGHRVVRSEPFECDGGHEHRVFVCPMRVGRARCGWRYVLPPVSDACSED